MSNLAVLENRKPQALREFSGELFERWTSYLDASPRTVETYTKNIRRFSVYAEEHGITYPQREDILAYRDYLKDNYKPTTVQGYMAAVKLFFSWTAQEGLYPNVAEHIKGAKLDAAHKKDYLTSRQTGQLLESIDRDTLKGKRDFAMLYLMITTGLREVSIIRANIGDIGVVGDAQALFYQGKGHDEKADYVKLAPPVEDAIRDYLSTRGVTDQDAPLFGSVANRDYGKRMTTRSVSRVAKTHMVSIGLDSDRLTAHSLRHTAATLNLLNGGSVEETQQLLGHRNINTTMIYSHALERASNRSEERIAAAFHVRDTRTKEVIIHTEDGKVSRL